MVHYQIRYLKEEGSSGKRLGSYSRTILTREFRSVRAAAEFISTLPGLGAELHSVRRVIYTDLSVRERWMLNKIVDDLT